MTLKEFEPIYKDLVAICGERHHDKDLNTRHLNGMFATLQKWDAGIVKRAVGRVRAEFGRTQYEAKWPTPGKLYGVCEDLFQSSNRGVFEPDKSFDQRRQEAELIRIDEAIWTLSEKDRRALNVDAAIRVLEDHTKEVASLVKGAQAPVRKTDERDKDWAFRMAYWLEEIRDKASRGKLHEGPMGMFTARFLVLSCKELMEAKIIMTMREIAKERGVI